MSTYVAFLRAINLGPTRKFGKDAILAATEGAGFTDVATHINTGNVHLETRLRSRARIEAALEKAYAADRGFEVPAIVFSTEQMRAMAEDAEELGGDHDGKHYVSLLKTEPSEAAVQALQHKAGDGERVVVRDRAAHLLVGASYLDAVLPRIVDKALGVSTSRNVTVLRAVTTKWC